MDELVTFLNDDVQHPIDPLLKMALAHYQLEAIHPFRDGNGRTGRILCILYLIQKKLLDLPILFLSAYILQNKDAYYQALGEVTGTRRWKQWILFMLEAVNQTTEYTTDKINRIRALMEKTETIVEKRKTLFPGWRFPNCSSNPIFDRRISFRKRLRVSIPPRSIFQYLKRWAF